MLSGSSYVSQITHMLIVDSKYVNRSLGSHGRRRGTKRDQQIFSSIASLYICVFIKKKKKTHDCPLLIKSKEV